MLEQLEYKPLNPEDIKFLKRKFFYGVRVLFLLALFSIALPGFFIYRIFIDSNITDKTFSFFMVIICFGFWTYVTIKGIKKIVQEKQNLYSQKKIAGNVKVLEKEIITIEGDESNDTYSYELKIYSEIENKHKKISILKKYYEKIQIGEILWIEYYLDCNYIKTLNFENEKIKHKTFKK